MHGENLKLKWTYVIEFNFCVLKKIIFLMFTTKDSQFYLQKNG